MSRQCKYGVLALGNFILTYTHHPNIIANQLHPLHSSNTPNVGTPPKQDKEPDQITPNVKLLCDDPQ